MRNIDLPRPHTSAPINPDRRAANERPTTWRLSPEQLSEAVIAGYIHDISIRHSSGAARRIPRERGDC